MLPLQCRHLFSRNLAVQSNPCLCHLQTACGHANSLSAGMHRPDGLYGAGLCGGHGRLSLMDIVYDGVAAPVPGVMLQQLGISLVDGPEQ